MQAKSLRKRLSHAFAPLDGDLGTSGLRMPAQFGRDTRDEILENLLIVLKRQVIRQLDPQFVDLTDDRIGKQLSDNLVSRTDEIRHEQRTALAMRAQCAGMALLGKRPVTLARPRISAIGRHDHAAQCNSRRVRFSPV